jgi:hypothetical protein
MATAPQATIFDIDGALIASLHDCAWWDALAAFADPAGFTMLFYQPSVAGRPRLEMAELSLTRLGDEALVWAARALRPRPVTETASHA